MLRQYNASSLHEVLPGAVIAGRGLPSAVMGMQSPSAVSARGDTLQQCGSFSDGTPRRMRLRPCVAGDASQILFVRGPVDVARVVLGDQHRPLRAGQSTHALAHDAVLVDMAFLSRSAERVGAGVGRIREHLVDGMVRRRYPADGAVVQAKRERQAFGAKPEPDAAHGPELRKALEDGTNGARNRLVGMQEDLAVAFAPDDPDWEPATELSASCLVANPAVEACTQDMQLGFRH